MDSYMHAAKSAHEKMPNRSAVFTRQLTKTVLKTHVIHTSHLWLLSNRRGEGEWHHVTHCTLSAAKLLCYTFNLHSILVHMELHDPIDW